MSENRVEFDQVTLTLPIDQNRSILRDGGADAEQGTQQKTSVESNKSTQKTLKLIKEKPEVTTLKMLDTLDIIVEPLLSISRICVNKGSSVASVWTSAVIVKSSKHTSHDHHRIKTKEARDVIEEISRRYSGRRN